MDRSPKSSQHRGLIVLAVLGVIAALYLLKAILVPIALALLLACLLSPLTTLLRRLLPLGPTGAAVVLFLLTVLLGLYVASLTAESLVQAANTLPTDIERLSGQVSRRDQRHDPRPALPARDPARAGDDRPARRRQPLAAHRQPELRPDRPDATGWRRV